MKKQKNNIFQALWKTTLLIVFFLLFGFSYSQADASWSTIAVDDSIGDIGKYSGLTVNSLVLGSDGYARIGYFDETNKDLKLAQCTNASCSTKNITTVDSTNDVGFYTSIALGSDGYVRMSYFDYTNSDLKFVQCTNASCSTKNITTVDSTGTVGINNSLAIGSDGYARISYFDGGSNGNLKFAQCTNASCSTSNITTIDSTGVIGLYTSTIIGSDGYARISYQDSTNQDLKFAQCTNASCSTKNITTVDSTGSVGAYSSIVLGSDGYPRISYYDATNGDLKFVQCTNASCSTNNITTVDSTDTVGYSTSIAIGSDGYPRISYYDYTNGNLKFAQCTNASCSTKNITTVDSTDNVGLYPSLAINSSGYPRISYFDTTNQDLKFAYQGINLDPKTVIDPIPEDIEEDITGGYISVTGTNTAASEAVINASYTLQSEESKITFPSGTTITPTQGGTMDITNLTASDISETVNQENPSSKSAIKVGITSQGLTFSQAVTITLNVSPDYNGETLKVYYRLDNEEDWTYETNCDVSDSKCTFTTDHATEYTAMYEVSNSPTPTDVNVAIDATISLTCSDSVTMGTITGTGQSNLTTNEAVCTVGTINSNGYQLSWQASTAYMENADGNQIDPYSPTVSNIPETWSVESSASEWGARIKSTSTDPDLTSGGIWDDLDSYSGNWLNVSTSPFVVANRSTETSQAGSTETILFGAEIGSNKFQPTGTYDVDVTVTATTL